MILAEQLPQYSTLSSIVDQLADPVTFVRAIFRSMNKEQRLRINLGTGATRPNYLFEEVMEPYAKGGGHEVEMEAFSGRTHKRLSLGAYESSGNWSAAAMTWQEVQALMGKLNKWTGPKKSSDASAKIAPSSVASVFRNVLK